jgi:hypothetical protein
MLGLFSGPPEEAPQQPQMTPQELAQHLSSMTPEQLSQMPHALLYQAREYLSPQQQGAISPYEHRAFAREYTQEHPERFMGTAGAVLAYQPYKAFMGARSAPDPAQVYQGLAGVKDGLLKRLKEIQQNVYYRDPFGDSTK